MRTCVMVVDSKTTEVLYRTGDRGDGYHLRWRDWDKRTARHAAETAGARFGEVLDYRPVVVKGRRFALVIVRRNGEANR